MQIAFAKISKSGLKNFNSPANESSPLRLRPRVQRQQILARRVFLHAQVASHRHLADIFRDLHRAVLGAAHAAEVGGFEGVLGERFVVVGAGRFGVEG